MAFLKINEAELSIEDGKASGAFGYFGERSRAFNGDWLSTSLYKKRSWKFTTTIYSNADAEAWARLIGGEGHYWGLDAATVNYYSSKGLYKTSGTGTGSAADGKFSGYTTIAAAGQIQWDCSLAAGAAQWTLMVWMCTGTPGGGGTWNHYIKQDDGTKYLNGASYGSAIDFLNVTSNTAKLGDTASVGNQYFCDFAVFPFRISAGQAYGFGNATRTFSSLPKLELEGAVNASSTEVVDVELEDKVEFDEFQYTTGGSWTLGKKLTFSLVES